MDGAIGMTVIGVTMTTMNTSIETITATGTTMVVGELETVISEFGSVSKTAENSKQKRAHSGPFLLFSQALNWC